MGNYRADYMEMRETLLETSTTTAGTGFGRSWEMLAWPSDTFDLLQKMRLAVSSLGQTMTQILFREAREDALIDGPPPAPWRRRWREKDWLSSERKTRVTHPFW